MRKEYDLSKGERGKFFGKVDTANPVIEADEGPLSQVIKSFGLVAFSNFKKT